MRTLQFKQRYIVSFREYIKALIRFVGHASLMNIVFAPDPSVHTREIFERRIARGIGMRDCNCAVAQ
jgi:hypothetical protein